MALVLLLLMLLLLRKSMSALFRPIQASSGFHNAPKWKYCHIT